MNDTIKFINDNAGILNLLFSLVVATATVFYVILTRGLVIETRRMRRAQSDPFVAVRIEPNEAWISIIMLVVENVGLGPAYNVQLRVAPDFEMDDAQHLSDIGLFKHGIKYLAPNQKIKLYLANIASHVKEIEQNTEKFKFTVTVTYNSASSLKASHDFPVDFLHLLGMSTIGKPPLNEIAKDLNDIRYAIERIQSGYSRLQVDAFTQQDRDQKKKEFEEESAAMRAQSTPNNVKRSAHDLGQHAPEDDAAEPNL